jgi:hypothetical protein
MDVRSLNWLLAKDTGSTRHCIPLPVHELSSLLPVRIVREHPRTMKEQPPRE